MDAVDLMNGDGKTIVTLRVDGNFDKTGLHDPLLLDFHFTLDTNKISALDIRLPGEGPRLKDAARIRVEQKRPPTGHRWQGKTFGDVA